MFRVYIPIIFFVVFIGWVLYRLLIKKDLKQNLNGFYLGLIFSGIWVLIYYFLVKQ